MACPENYFAFLLRVLVMRIIATTMPSASPDLQTKSIAVCVLLVSPANTVK